MKNKPEKLMFLNLDLDYLEYLALVNAMSPDHSDETDETVKIVKDPGELTASASKNKVPETGLTLVIFFKRVSDYSTQIKKGQTRGIQAEKLEKMLREVLTQVNPASLTGLSLLDCQSTHSNGALVSDTALQHELLQIIAKEIPSETDFALRVANYALESFGKLRKEVKNLAIMDPISPDFMHLLFDQLTQSQASEKIIQSFKNEIENTDIGMEGTTEIREKFQQKFIENFVS